MWFSLELKAEVEQSKFESNKENLNLESRDAQNEWFIHDWACWSSLYASGLSQKKKRKHNNKVILSAILSCSRAKKKSKWCALSAHK